MKKFQLLAAAIMLSAPGMAQRSCDLEITGGVIGKTITIDASAKIPTYFEFKFKNNGPDDLLVSDTIYFKSPLIEGNAILKLNPISIKAGTTFSLKDTIFFDSGPSSGLDTICHIALFRSSATAIASDPNDTNNIFCQVLTVINKTTGISDFFSTNKKVQVEQLRIAPNPASGLIGFDFVSKASSEVVVHVYDLTGRTITSHSYGNVQVGRSEFTLDISSLNPGFYFVEFSQGSERAVGKLIKE